MKEIGTIELIDYNLKKLNPEQSIFICACEPSGDLYGSLFIKSHLKNHKNIFGVGGENLRNTNVNLVYDYKDLKTFGFTSGIISFIKNYLMYRKISRAIIKTRPVVFIAVAYPGLNLLLCRYAKKMGIRVVYLLPPQIWAWGGFRKYFIKKWVDLVISVFPFEYRFYISKKIKTVYMQNPLFDELKRYKKKNPSGCIGFMPGSRISEMKRNIPLILELINNCVELQNFKFTFIIHPDLASSKILDRLMTKGVQDKLRFVISDRYEEMCKCDLIITCSGTASLETAIIGIPQIFFNRPGFFDYHFFRYLLKIKEYNLSNLYYEKKIVPGFVLRDKKKLVRLLSSELHKFLSKSF
uniref:Lipid-A-disaccharide synthase n=1 Tax=candidate division WOR-3 bacterium TaxID=2052148 RepID=A0A7V0Z4Y6_UNCW3